MATRAESHDVRAAIARRTGDIVEALLDLDDEDLTVRSELPGWSRLTIACHLRYGAEALRRMTGATLSGRPTAYYPQGRARQRAGTLLPNDGEGSRDVVNSLALHSRMLAQAWSAVDAEGWSREINEPEDNPDLGPVTLTQLALLRLTEVEVHGSDLGVDLDDWSAPFVTMTLPMRFDRLNSRTVDHRDGSLEGSWLFVASDGPTYRVSVTNGVVESIPAIPHAPARAALEATSRDLLALLLGRPFRRAPRITGDLPFGEAFSAAFPGP
jgi:uncharacterized protein (TIGR03083 family)